MSVSAKPPGPAGPEGRVCHGTRRDGILEAARAVVPRNGFEHTSIAAIAGRAGFARAAVHQHFCDIDRDESRAGRTKTLAAEIGALVFFAFTHRTLLARGPPPWGLGERGGSRPLGRERRSGDLAGPKQALRPDPSSTPPRVWEACDGPETTTTTGLLVECRHGYSSQPRTRVYRVGITATRFRGRRWRCERLTCPERVSPVPSGDGTG